jgi:hypothetical protein
MTTDISKMSVIEFQQALFAAEARSRAEFNNQLFRVGYVAVGGSSAGIIEVLPPRPEVS